MQDNNISIIDQMKDLVLTISKLCYDQKFSEVDTILENVDIAESSTFILIGYCRTTYPARHDLKYWQTFIDAVKIEFINRGDDKILLHGLVKSADEIKVI